MILFWTFCCLSYNRATFHTHWTWFMLLLQVFPCFEQFSFCVLIYFTIFCTTKTWLFYIVLMYVTNDLLFSSTSITYLDFSLVDILALNNPRAKMSLYLTWHLLNHNWICVCILFSKNTCCKILVPLKALSFFLMVETNFVILVFSWFLTLKNNYPFLDFLLTCNWVMPLITLINSHVG